jgi:hypothetical protein
MSLCLEKGLNFYMVGKTNMIQLDYEENLSVYEYKFIWDRRELKKVNGKYYLEDPHNIVHFVLLVFKVIQQLKMYSRLP